MPRHIKIGLIVLGIGFAVALGFFVNIVGRVQSMMKNERETEEKSVQASNATAIRADGSAHKREIVFPAGSR
jgi:hypothetical protein